MGFKGDLVWLIRNSSRSNVGSLVDFRFDFRAECFLRGQFQQLPRDRATVVSRKLTIKAFTSCGAGMKEAIVPAQFDFDDPEIILGRSSP